MPRPTVRRPGAAGLLRPAGVALAALAALVVVGLVDPNQPGHYPSCPFLFLTGHWCPGCGSLRALHAVAHGDLAGAVAHNLLTVAAMPLLGWLWLRWARRSWTGAPRPAPARASLIWLMWLVVVAFWLLRNAPLGAFSSWLAP